MAEMFIQGVGHARLVGMGDGLGADSQQKAAVLERLRAMTDSDRARHLDALKHGANSEAMKELRRRLLAGLITETQRACLECAGWIPGAVTWCSARGCAYWQGRPYQPMTPKGEPVKGGVARITAADGGGGPDTSGIGGGVPFGEEVPSLRRCECGAPLPMRAAGRRGSAFCESCIRDRRHEQVWASVRRFREKASRTRRGQHANAP